MTKLADRLTFACIAACAMLMFTEGCKLLSPEAPRQTCAAIKVLADACGVWVSTKDGQRFVPFELLERTALQSGIRPESPEAPK